jgi:hypothetical protein
MSISSLRISPVPMEISVAFTDLAPLPAMRERAVLRFPHRLARIVRRSFPLSE